MNDQPASSSPSSAFKGSGLACVRGGRIVFAGLGFELAEGGALVLLGPNGSGKSSLLRLLAGLLKPAAGRLTWKGQPVSEDPEAHAARSHYVGHHDAIKPVLNVAENLRFWARLHEPHAQTAEGSVAAALDAFGLSRFATVPGKMLSAGQKRRTNLARLLAAPSPLWLLDEPTTALDRASVKAFEGVLAGHRARGGMVVVSTHTDIDLPGAVELHMDRFSRDPLDEEAEAFA